MTQMLKMTDAQRELINKKLICHMPKGYAAADISAAKTVLERLMERAVCNQQEQDQSVTPVVSVIREL